MKKLEASAMEALKAVECYQNKIKDSENALEQELEKLQKLTPPSHALFLQDVNRQILELMRLAIAGKDVSKRIEVLQRQAQELINGSKDTK